VADKTSAQVFNKCKQLLADATVNGTVDPPSVEGKIQLAIALVLLWSWKRSENAAGIADP
jgi:hypothetical protein